LRNFAGCIRPSDVKLQYPEIQLLFCLTTCLLSIPELIDLIPAFVAESRNAIHEQDNGNGSLR